MIVRYARRALIAAIFAALLTVGLLTLARGMAGTLRLHNIPHATLAATTAAGVESVLYRFSGPPGDGNGPSGGLLGDSTGALYGITIHGGNAGIAKSGLHCGCGIAFELTLAGGKYTEKVIHEFGKGNDGAYPEAGFIADASGNLYSVTPAGGANSCKGPSGTVDCGTVFRLKRSGSTYVETILYNFTGGSDGFAPNGTLTAGNGGVMYGVTGSGGLGYGTVFKLVPSGSTFTEKVVYRFLGEAKKDGSGPIGKLYVDGSGALYGTTYFGGTGACSTSGVKLGCGTVFKLSPSGSSFSYKVIYDFAGTAAFLGPQSGVIGDRAGNLYGSTNGGKIFKLTLSGSTYVYSTIDSLLSKDGSQPTALLGDSAGNLYFTTSSAVIELVPASGKYSERVLHAFTGPPDGYEGLAPLIADKSGTLYSTSYAGGYANGSCGNDIAACGTVYKVVH